MALLYDDKAYKLLKKCSNIQSMSEWNQYRKENNYAYVNLRFTDLNSTYLKNADLQNVDLRGADLANSKCHGADVKGTNISNDIYWKSYILTIVLVIAFMLCSKLGSEDLEFVGIFGIAFLSLVSVFNSFIGFKRTNSIIGLGIIGVHSIIAIVFVMAGVSVSTIFFDLHNSILVGTLAGIVVGINNIKGTIELTNKYNQQCIVKAKNQMDAIGFDDKYLKEVTIPLSIQQKKELKILEELIEKETDIYKVKILEKKLKESRETLKSIKEKEKYTQEQKIKISLATKHILKPYEYMNKNIIQLNRHNGFFYLIILALIGAFGYAYTYGYLDSRSKDFSLLLKNDGISFGTIFGTILFYATPILFGISLIVYAICQINKNIQKIESMQEQKRNIEVLQSTLLAQTEIGEVSDEEIKSIIQALQKGALEKMFGKDEKEVVEETRSYREKLLVSNISKLLTQTLKSSKR